MLQACPRALLALMVFGEVSKNLGRGIRQRGEDVHRQLLRIEAAE
jgi:hypothetical protein